MKGNSSKAKSKRSLGGFTLVELIVVIAVLAILAGVGAVAYSGYIEYTNKGVDRQTVGEIIHALELADYADPTLFGTKGAGVVHITDSGITTVSTGEKLKAGLKDAFGEELSSYSLKYSKWNGKNPDFSIFSNFIDASGNLTGALAQYQDVIKDGGSASYASEMEDLWEIVGAMLPLQQQQSHRDDYLQILVDYCNQDSTGGTNITDSIVNSWTSGSTPNSIPNVNKDHQVGAALAMAQNYAFATYAKTHPSMDAEHLKILDKYTSFDADSVPQAAISYYVSATAIFSDIETEGGYWYKIAKDYQASQAKIDALAFQSLMQAANSASESLNLKDSSGKIKDDDFYDAMTNYVDTVGALMVEPELINVYKDISSSGISGNYIAVSAYKQGGKLTIVVSPDDADPRTESGSMNDVPQEGEGVDYTEDNSTVTCQNTDGNNWQSTVTMHAGESITIGLDKLPPSGWSFTTVSGVTCDSASGNKVTIGSGTSGGTIVISWESPLPDDMPELAGSITINVVVK